MGILQAERTDKRLSYWDEVWKELCHSIQKGDICVKLLNPHMLILDILEEYELNKLKNKRNRMFFIRTIEIFLKDNLIVKQFFTKEYIILKDKLENKDYSCIYSLCQQINDFLLDRKYAHLVFKMLKGILMRPAKADDYKKIKRLSLELITEFIIFDHSLPSVEFYVDNIFSLDICNDEINRHFIDNIKNHNFRLKDFKSEEDFKNAANMYIKHLTIKDRIEVFEKYIDKEKVKVDYFFKAIGLKITGEAKTYSLNNCVAYDPFAISYLHDELDNNKRMELFNFGFEVPTKNNFCIIKVSVFKIEDDAGFPEDDVGFHEAFEQAIFFFNTLKILYGSSRYESYLVSRYYFGVTEDDERFASFGWDLRSGIEEKPEKISSENMVEIGNSIKLSSFYEEVSAQEINLINRSIMFFTKGKEAQTTEDKLLNFWICIETLLKVHDNNKFDIIQTTASNTAILFRKTEELKNLYRIIRYNYRTDLQTFPEENVVTLSKNMAEKFGMEEHCTANFLVFKENLKELRQYTNRPAILDSIDSVYRFYNDNAYAFDLLSDEEQKVKEEILYIYKYRNQVVHNGYVNKSILPHIVNAAQKHAKNLILLFIASFSLYKFDVDQTIKKINKEKEQLISGLREDKYFEVKFELFTDTNLFF